jgi:hypothetical protein
MTKARKRIEDAVKNAILTKLTNKITPMNCQAGQIKELG